MYKIQKKKKKEKETKDGYYSLQQASLSISKVAEKFQMIVIASSAPLILRLVYQQRRMKEAVQN